MLSDLTRVVYRVRLYSSTYHPVTGLSGGVGEGIQLADSCVARLNQITNNQPGSYLRVMVEGGGCSGFQVYAHPPTTVIKFAKIYFTLIGRPVCMGFKRILSLHRLFLTESWDLLDEGEGHEILLRVHQYCKSDFFHAGSKLWKWAYLACLFP